MKKTALWIDPQRLDAPLRREIEAIRVVDTHEHLDEESVRLKQPINLTRFFMYYAFDDVATSGMSPEDEGRFFGDTISAVDQWKLIRKFWPKARETGYCRAVRLSINELYGIDDLRDDTIKPLMAAVAKRNRPGVTRWILEEKCGIECCLVNAGDPGDLSRRTGLPGLFLFDLAVSLVCGGMNELQQYEKFSGVDASTLHGCKRMIDWYFARWGKQVVALKQVCAYWRTLDFELVGESRASVAYEKCRKKGQVEKAVMKAAQDHLMHYCIQKAMDYDIPVKFHTGYHSGHNYSDMNILNVRDLAPLFKRYPKARFDLMHMSYPEWGDLLALTKHYANVQADLCWAWVIDPMSCISFLRQAVHTVPSNKVFAFGGDYGFADTVYGHCRIARDGVALVLSEAVAEGRLSRTEAVSMAKAWLRENAMEYFKIDAKRAEQAKGQP